MTKLCTLAQRLPDSAVLSLEETNSIKGGKRYQTTSYGNFRYLKNMLRCMGYNAVSTVDGNDYCLEW